MEIIMGILNKLKFWDNTVNLTAYTSSAEIAENTPPLLNKQKAPWFFKNISTEGYLDPASSIVRPHSSVLGCPGIRDYLNTGIHIRMWSDLIVKIWPDGKFTYLFPEMAKFNTVQSHSHNQFGDLYPEDRVSIKLINPWAFKTDKSVKFLMADSHYSTSFFRNNNLWVPPGIVDFSKQISTNIHVVCPVKSEPYEIHFKYGQHLVTFFPLTEKNINLNVKIETEYNINQMVTLPSTFKNKYYIK